MSAGVTSRELDTQLALLYREEHNDLKVTIEPVQQQRGGSDCGLFAIAFCSALASNQDPTTLRYRQSRMRSHLSEIIKPFPLIHGKQRNGIITCLKETITIALLCVFRLLYYAFNQMIECHKCKQWYHKPCAGITNTQRLVLEFHCHVCNRNKT